MDINDILEDAEDAPLATQLFYERAFDVVDRVHELLEGQGKTQKDLAKLLGKSPSEVSKWLTGQHNLTLKSITSMEAVLGEAILVTPGKGRGKKAKSAGFQTSGRKVGFIARCKFGAGIDPAGMLAENQSLNVKVMPRLRRSLSSSERLTTIA